MFWQKNISRLCVLCVIVLCMVNFSWAEDFSVLPLNKVIRLKPTLDSALPGSTVKVKRLSNGMQIQFLTPEMQVDPNPVNAEPIGYEIIVNPSTKQFTLKEEQVPDGTVFNGESEALRGVDVWNPPDNIVDRENEGATVQSAPSGYGWYGIKTLALTEDPPPLDTDLCKTWTRMWVQLPYDPWWGYSCYLTNGYWDYVIGWAANPTSLGTHWFIRKTVATTPYEAFLYFADIGYTDWFWVFPAKGVYWNADFLDDAQTTTVKHKIIEYWRVVNCSQHSIGYRALLTLVYEGEATNLLHSHWYVQGVKQW